MKDHTQKSRKFSIGLDLGDRNSYVVGVTREGEIVIEDKKVPTTRDAFRDYFSQFDRNTQVVCEAGTHSPWVSALLTSLGLKVIVANPNRAGRALAANGKKNDRLDSLTLATMGLDSCSLHLLRPVKHRGDKAQADLAVIRARSCAVAARTQLINAVRGLVKSSGERLPSCSGAAFHRKVLDAVPEAVKPAVDPLIRQVGELTSMIRAYDKTIEELSACYPETKRLRAIAGVGPLIALAYVLTIDDPKRFRCSRDVGAYLGLVPKQWASGDSAPQLRITKAGDTYLRQLLVNGAHYILGPFGGDCELRRFGMRIGCRGGPKGKKRAVVAVARKLAVIMHRLLLSGEPYDPFYRDSRRRSA